MAKKIVSLLFVIAGATAAMAQDSLPGQLAACLEIPGVLQRLACYDRVAHGAVPAFAARPRTVPADRPVARAAPPVAYAAPPLAAAAPNGLGSERLPRTTSLPKSAQEMTDAVASVSYDPRGRFTITLENGQVWRQLEGDTGELRESRISAVRISRGALGSYDLNIVGRNATYRVLRLQ